jgi:hypothetical protein
MTSKWAACVVSYREKSWICIEWQRNWLLKLFFRGLSHLLNKEIHRIQIFSGHPQDFIFTILHEVSWGHIPNSSKMLSTPNLSFIISSVNFHQDLRKSGWTMSLYPSVDVFSVVSECKILKFSTLRLTCSKVIKTNYSF